MSVRQFLRRADQAVMDTKDTVSATALIAAGALVVAVAALIVVIVRTK